MIADDHEVVRSGLRSILESQPNWEVVAEAADGKEAILKAIATKPEVVVLDYSLPVFNGVEATRQIRAHVPQTEVLIFTMHESETLIRDLLQAGARGYLLKSDAKQFLITAVQSLAAHKPFFTSRISETLLESFLTTTEGDRGILTARERTVVQLIAEGRTNRQSASMLGIGMKTVETQRATAMRKLNLTSTAAVVRYAIRNQMLEA